MRLKFIRPMEPELFDTPTEGDDWSHEIKFDGYRTQVIKDEDGIRLLTKNGFDWTARYRYLGGKPPRSRLKPSSSKASLGAASLMLLYGHDLRAMPLDDRPETLQGMITDGGRIQFSEALPGTGDAVYHLVNKASLEGMVSKRKDSAYRSGPTRAWRKIKCFEEKQMDIIGVQRDPGKAAQVIIAEMGHYKGGAFIAFRADKRQALWDRVQGKSAARSPRGIRRTKPSG